MLQISGPTEDSLIGAQLISGASGNLFATALNSLHLLMLFKYVDVGYPPNIEELYTLLSKNSSSSDSASSTNVLNIFKKLGNDYALEESEENRFHKFGAKTFFLTNIGSSLIINTGVLLLIGILNLLRLRIKNKKANRILSEKVLPVFQWNMPLNSIIGGQTRYALAWFLQFSNPFGNTYSIINFAVSLVVLVMILAVYIATAFQISWNWSITKEKLFLSRQVMAKVQTKQAQLATIWKAYDIKSLTGRYFIIIQMLRNTLQVAIICTMYKYPLAQCYSLGFLSLLYLVILGTGRPFNRTIDMIAAISNETCLLFEEILMTTFATNLTKKFLTVDLGNTLGWVMIGIIFLSLGMNGLCIVAVVVVGIIQAIKKRKQQNSKKAKTKRGQASYRKSVRTIDLSEKSVHTRSGKSGPRKNEKAVYMRSEKTDHSKNEKVDRRKSEKIEAHRKSTKPVYTKSEKEVHRRSRKTSHTRRQVHEVSSRRWEPRIINYIENDSVDLELKDSSTKPSSENRRFL